MDDAKNFISKYWPWLLGGLIALYLIMRSGSASSSSSGTDYATYLAAQSQAAGQAAQVGLAQQAQDQSNALANATLNAQVQSNAGQQQIDYLNAQGSVAQAVGGAAAQLVGALYQPSIVAMSGANYENGVALQSAAGIASTGFVSQSAMLDSASKSIGSVASGLQTFGNVKAPQSTSSQLLQTFGMLGSQVVGNSNPFRQTNFLGGI